MQKTKITTNDLKSSNIKETVTKENNKNNPFAKLIKFNKESYFSGKTKIEKSVFIKKILIIIFVFLLMVGSIVGASFAIIGAQKKQTGSQNINVTTISLTDNNKE